MILLENHSVIIHDVLTERFVKPSKLDIQFVDYDNVRFHLSTPSSKTQILLSLAIQCWPDIQRYGARQLLESEYGEWLLPEAETEPEYNVSLVIDLEKVPAEGEDRVALISHLSLLKRAALSAPFLRAFETQSKLGAAFAATNVPSQQEQAAPEQGELMQIRPREDEAIYIQASHDRVTVVFSTVFKEETDREFGKIFLQEFVDARRQQSMQNAPQVMYSSREPPLEIRHMPGLATSENVGYVTFVLFPRHFANPEMAIATTARIQLFRDYLHYHIKCSKAYMHSRMRYRVAEFLKVLNRAKPEVAIGERKTASGRTFRSR